MHTENKQTRQTHKISIFAYSRLPSSILQGRKYALGITIGNLTSVCIDKRNSWLRFAGGCWCNNTILYFSTRCRNVILIFQKNYLTSPITNFSLLFSLQPNTRPTRKLMNRSGANNSHLSCLFSYLLQHSTFLMRLKPS